VRFSESVGRSPPSTFPPLRASVARYASCVRKDLMRSLEAPRIRHDATVKLQARSAGGAIAARSVNLSVGGMFVESERQLDPGAHVEITVNLGDGGAPLPARGQVVWVRDQGAGAPAGMALRFVGLDEMSERRIARLVENRARDAAKPAARTIRV